MRRALFLLAVGVLSLPLIFVMWLLLAVRWSRMDALTMKMPLSLRATVASAIVGQPSKQAIERANRIDPGGLTRSGLRRGGRRTIIIDRPEEARGLYQQGEAAERSGNECEAANFYTRAAGAASSEDGAYLYVEAMGKAEYFCGDMPSARAGLEASVFKEGKVIQDPSAGENAIAAAKKDMVADRQFLVLVYQKQDKEDLARSSCLEAHMGWQVCSCRLSGRDAVCQGR